jgi:hypothetical protein
MELYQPHPTYHAAIALSNKIMKRPTPITWSWTPSTCRTTDPGHFAHPTNGGP